MNLSLLRSAFEEILFTAASSRATRWVMERTGSQEYDQF